MESLGIIAVVMVSYGASFFIVAHCIFLIAIGDDLESEMRILNENIRFETGNKKKFSINRQIEIKNQLGKFIQFHCDAKQLSGCRISYIL